MIGQIQHARWLAAPLFAALVSCGGGTDGTGATPPPSAVTSSGVMTKGSVILNGVHFDDSHAVVTDDRNRTVAQLATGMVVKLRGVSSGSTGDAKQVKIVNEARGLIQSIDVGASPQRFTVVGLTVLIDSKTVYANLVGLAGLSVGTRVEVHGLGDSSGYLHASRVELVGSADGLDELRGVVSNLNTTTHQLTLNGNVNVNYAGATFQPSGASEAAIAAGIFITVRGSSAGATFSATQLAIESLEDSDFNGNVSEHQEIEGFVSGFTATPGTFQVNDRTVLTTAATVFVDGSSADLANNVEVEVEGTIDGNGMLVADRIQFENTRIQIQGLAMAVDTNARTVVVLGQTVRANDVTRIDALSNGGGASISLVDIRAGIDCVEVRGAMSGPTLTADEIKELASCDRDQVQAQVVAKDTTTFTLTFFSGLNAALGGPNVEFQGVNDRTAFFAAVVPSGSGTAGTLVRVRGTFTGGVLVADQAQLEN